MKTEWGLSSAIGGREALHVVEHLFQLVLATLHSPQYEEDHQDGLAQDWARVPIPKDWTVVQSVAALGTKVGAILDASAGANEVLRELLGTKAKCLGVVTKSGRGQIGANDLAISVSYYGAAKGKWREREYEEGEIGPATWGTTTGDLFINDNIFVRNVPAAVWRYELGGYPVLKKWLGYRQASRRNGRPLSLGEVTLFRSIVQRIAALLALRPQLDASYAAAVEDAWTAEDLGVR